MPDDFDDLEGVYNNMTLGEIRDIEEMFDGWDTMPDIGRFGSVACAITAKNEDRQ